jgi:hypothetical protein
LYPLTALDFRAYLGGEEKINAYCRKLAREGGKRLAEMMGTEVMTSMSEESGEDELTLNMVRSSSFIPLLGCNLIPSYPLSHVVVKRMLYEIR